VVISIISNWNWPSLGGVLGPVDSTYPKAHPCGQHGDPLIHHRHDHGHDHDRVPDTNSRIQGIGEVGAERFSSSPVATCRVSSLAPRQIFHCWKEREERESIRRNLKGAKEGRPHLNPSFQSSWSPPLTRPLDIGRSSGQLETRPNGASCFSDPAEFAENRSREGKLDGLALIEIEEGNFCLHIIILILSDRNLGHLHGGLKRHEFVTFSFELLPLIFDTRRRLL
jgi:hypothetical protein